MLHIVVVDTGFRWWRACAQPHTTAAAGGGKIFGSFFKVWTKVVRIVCSSIYFLRSEISESLD